MEISVSDVNICLTPPSVSVTIKTHSHTETLLFFLEFLCNQISLLNRFTSLKRLRPHNQFTPLKHHRLLSLSMLPKHHRLHSPQRDTATKLSNVDAPYRLGTSTRSAGRRHSRVRRMKGTSCALSGHLSLPTITESFCKLEMAPKFFFGEPDDSKTFCVIIDLNRDSISFLRFWEKNLSQRANLLVTRLTNLTCRSLTRMICHLMRGSVTSPLR